MVFGMVEETAGPSPGQMGTGVLHLRHEARGLGRAVGRVRRVATAMGHSATDTPEVLSRWARGCWE